MKEEDLYEPVKNYLLGQGYKVNSEVKNCDITAVKDNELIIIELKMRFSLSLVYQAVNRKDITDSVYVAIPLNSSKSTPPNYRSLKKLLLRLEIGLIFVRFLKSKIRVEVISHPKEFIKRVAQKRKKSILREINGRYGEFNKGGSSTMVENITTYKQQSIHIAYLLSLLIKSSPKRLIEISGIPKAQQILSQNHYGWFDKISRGVYSLNKVGLTALKQYQKVIDSIPSEFIVQE